MRPQIKDLETVGLITSSKDDVDNRRKSIQLTAKGQFVGYALKNKAE
jgi:DNA-binding MarR family transcriptional regulator